MALTKSNARSGSEEQGAGANARAKIQVVTTAMPLGKAQRRDIREWGRILTESVPPHQLIEHGLALVIELFDRPPIMWVHLFLPFAPHIGYSVAASTLDLSQILARHVAANLGEQTVLEILVSFKEQRPLPDLSVVRQQAVLHALKRFGCEFLLDNRLPQLLQLVG
jgi:hypothetical protein